MKKIYTSLFVAASTLLGFNLEAQTIPQYVFQTLNGQSYNAITGGSVIPTTTADDNIYLDPNNLSAGGTTGPGWPIGFNFTFGLNVYDRVGMNNNGYIYLGSSLLTPALNIDNGGYSTYTTPMAFNTSAAPTLNQARIAAFANDLYGTTGNGGSNIRIETIGTAPNRTCVIQYSGYVNHSIQTDNLNFQFRLFETSNIVDVAYGTMTHVNSNSNYICQVGLRGSAAVTDFNMRTISQTDTWPASLAANAITNTCDYEFHQPSTGLTYRWLPPVPCVGSPAPIAVLGPTYQVCPGSLTSLNYSPTYTNIGITYQWQSSTISPLGPWTSITSATNAAFTSTNNANTYYSLLATCSNGNGTTQATSAGLIVAGTTTNSIPYVENFENISYVGQLPNCSWLLSSNTTTGVAQTQLNSTTGYRFADTGNGYMSFAGSSGTTNIAYTNGLQLYPGVTYSASVRYLTDNTANVNFTSLSLSVGSSQSTSGLTNIASISPAVATQYKTLGGTFTVSSAGIYYIAIREVSSGANSNYLSIDNFSVTIPCSINSPTLAVSGVSTVCLGSPVNLTASGANTYSWTNGQGFNATTAGISNTPNQSGIFFYTVIGTNTLANCPTTVSKQVNVIQGPVVSPFMSDPNNGVCPGATAVLYAVGSANSYTWSTTGLAGANTTIAPTANTTYTVLGSNLTNCITKATIDVVVYNAPNVGGSPSRATICVGESVILTGTGADSYMWVSPAIVLSGAVVNANPTVPTNYQLTGTDIATGCTASALVSVNVAACTGLNSVSASNANISVYPNPNNGEFTVELNNASVKTIHVTDVTGRILMSNTTSDASVNFNINNLSSGVYYVKVQSAENISVIKVVKQ